MAHNFVHRAQQALQSKFGKRVEAETGVPPVAKKVAPKKPVDEIEKAFLFLEAEQRREEKEAREKKKREGGSSHQSGHKPKNKGKSRKKRHNSSHLTNKTRF